MATRAHRAAHRLVGRWVLVAVLVLGAVAAAALVALVAPAGGEGARAAPAAAAPAAATYPREVRVADLPDTTLRRTALAADPPVTVLVELAPGVYADRGAGPLGAVDDYTAVFGRCADVNRYARSHRVGFAC
jgi:hypothetical protein